MLAYFPTGARVVVTVDVERMRGTALGRLLAASGRELPGLGRLEEVCGFDPTEAIDEVGVALPTAPLSGAAETDFAAVMMGDFSTVQLTACATAIVNQRGGEAVQSRLGSFTSVRDRRERDGGEIAVRDEGPVILGGGSYLREVVDTAEGRVPSEQQEGRHAELRNRVGKPGALLASWVIADGPTAESPTEVDAALSALRGGALRLDFTPGLELKLLLACDSKPGRDQVTAAVEQGKRRLGPHAKEWLGLDLGRVRMAETPTEVVLSLNLTPNEARALITRLRARLGPLLGVPVP